MTMIPNSSEFSILHNSPSRSFSHNFPWFSDPSLQEPLLLWQSCLLLHKLADLMRYKPLSVSYAFDLENCLNYNTPLLLTSRLRWCCFCYPGEGNFPIFWCGTYNLLPIWVLIHDFFFHFYCQYFCLPILFFFCLCPQLFILNEIKRNQPK